MILLGLLACAGEDPLPFAYARAEAICAWHARCDTLAAAGFAGEDACREALETAADQMDRQGELGCAAWDAEAADACLAVWEEAACDVPLDLTPCAAVCGEAAG